MKSMKAINLLPSLDVGGVELHVTELAEHLALCGVENVVASAGGALVQRIEAAGARHVILPLRRKSPAALVAIPRLRRLIRRERPDILHAHSRLPAWIARGALASLPRVERPAFVTTIHGLNSVSRYSAVMASGDRVVAVSRTAAAYASAHYPVLKDNPPLVIEGSVDFTRFHPGIRPDAAWVADFEATYPATRGKRLILLPGRLTRLKGHADAVKALAMAKDAGVCLVFAGGVAPGKGAYAREIEALAQEKGVAGHVVFTGARADLPLLMAHCALTIAPSTKPESFGRTVVESLAVGTPVLGYDHGGVGEILAATYPAGRVPLGDVAMLAQKMAHPMPAPAPLSQERYGKHREMEDIMALYRTLER